MNRSGFSAEFVAQAGSLMFHRLAVGRAIISRRQIKMLHPDGFDRIRLNPTKTELKKNAFFISITRMPPMHLPFNYLTDLTHLTI
jgi:hypothetical protein